MEVEDGAAPRLGIEAVREVRLDTRAFVAEGQGAKVRGKGLWQALAVFLRLHLDPGEGRPLLLRLDDSRGAPVHVGEVIGEAMAGLEREVADGHTAGRKDVRLRGILHGPAGDLEHPVNLLSCLLFGRLHHRKDSQIEGWAGVHLVSKAVLGCKQNG
jgi:hypothetical protein